MCLVSVIMPTYNRAHLLDCSVRSVLNQTLSDFELLIIDDGSTDRTQEKVFSFQDDRIKYVYKGNSGVSSARNVGLDAAEGNYIAFLDDDDCWPNDYLEKMIDKLQENKEYGLAYCRFSIKNDGRVLKTTDLSLCVSGRLTVNLFQNSFILPSTSVISRHVMNGLRFDEALDTSEDSDYYLRLSVYTNFLFVRDMIVEKNETPMSLANKINCNRIRSLERFFYRLNGKQDIPLKIANKKLSKSCRQTAKNYLRLKNYKAANHLLLRAIRYNPYRWNLYFEYIHTKLLSLLNNAEWKQPEPLAAPIMSVRGVNYPFISG